jgi:hypothetical protein
MRRAAVLKKWTDVSRNGVLDNTRRMRLMPLHPDRMTEALRIYAEHGAQAKGEPYGTADNLRAANGTIAEAQFADHYGLPWSGGVTVKDPRSVIADVWNDIQVYTSGDLDGRLIVHADELVAEQRWVHLAGVAPDDLWFIGWTTVEDIKSQWDTLPGDPRQTGGKVIGQSLLQRPATFDIGCHPGTIRERCRLSEAARSYCHCLTQEHDKWCGVCRGLNPNCKTCDGKSVPQ